MAFSSLAGLRDAGVPAGQLSEAQQAVPADLTPPEAGTLTSVTRVLPARPRTSRSG